MSKRNPVKIRRVTVTRVHRYATGEYTISEGGWQHNIMRTEHLNGKRIVSVFKGTSTCPVRIMWNLNGNRLTRYEHPSDNHRYLTTCYHATDHVMTHVAGMIERGELIP